MYPSISIIVPVYNVGPYIERCLRSVMGQTYGGPLECLLIDDCGTDNSMEVARALVDGYQGAIVFREVTHSKNRGLSAARNTGMDAAMGEYLFFLDSDDALPPDSLEKLILPILKDPTIEMVMGNREMIFDGLPTSLDTNQLCETDLNSSEKVRDYYLTKWLSVGAWNKLLRKEFLKKNGLFFREGLLHEDWLWTHYVMRHLNHLYLIPDSTYVFYRRPQSITTGICEAERARHIGLIYEEIAKSFLPEEGAKEAMHYFRDFCSLFCRYSSTPSYQRTALYLRGALSDGQHRKERLALSFLIFLSKTWMGRRIMAAVWKTYNTFRRII